MVTPTSLEVLNLQQNRLEAISPQFLSSLPQLTTLNVSRNCLNQLPEYVCLCPSLKELNVASNHLNSLPMAGNMPRIGRASRSVQPSTPTSPIAGSDAVAISDGVEEPTNVITKPLIRQNIWQSGINLSKKSPCSYRNATGGGVNKALEEALAKGLGSMSEADEKIARALGPEVSFGGLRVAESCVGAAPPSECSNPRASQELLQQLSTFESDSDTDREEIPRKRGRKPRVREKFLEEQTRYIRQGGCTSKKKYAMLTKVDSLLDKIQITVFIQPNNGAVHTAGQRTTKTDPNIEESLLLSRF
ncbi:unnamed protein product [Cylicocyclus nassatus]|uniref:Uncharacterized protein n=1 Tax=Cylicocyclus nassatus TaxID=53992 RepID=A0AA36GWK1_CYLNA|nr:unnamed protein product [Cylicocyclus nassatus]